jgi:hypothetical protein
MRRLIIPIGTPLRSSTAATRPFAYDDRPLRVIVNNPEVVGHCSLLVAELALLLLDSIAALVVFTAELMAAFNAPTAD